MNEPERDDLSLEGLAWPVDAPPSDGLRAALLAQTSDIVRGRARRRRLRLASSWGLAYAAGLATAWLAWPRDDRSPTAPADMAQIAAVERAPAAVEEDSLASPEELRSRVIDAPRDEQIRLLSMAGDGYLFGRADLASALDCYRQVIELTPRAELARPDEDDSWLLAELKSSAAGSVAQYAGE